MLIENALRMYKVDVPPGLTWLERSQAYVKAPLTVFDVLPG